MSELGRDPLIRLPIDQEVFIDAINIGDGIEDATVATEVISFQRDGDAYELEGAVVFAGYVRKAEGESDAARDSFAVGLDDEETEVHHVNHRMPFTLRVPVSAQTGGFVNVKSRLSGWTLDVVNDNWLSVKGTLEIHGLFGEQGYHFRCGLQEEGSAFFTNTNSEEEDFAESADEDVTTNALHQDDQSDAIADEADSVDESEPERDLVAAGDNMWRNAQDDELRGDEETADDESDVTEDTEGQVQAEAQEVQKTAEAQRHSVSHDESERVSEARGGHGWAETDSTRAAKDVRDGASVERAQKGKVQNELANLDRFFVQPSPASQPHEGEEDRSEEPSVENKTLPVASFEFEHQIDDELEGEPTNTPQVPQLEGVQNDFRGDEEAGPRFTISGAVAFDDNDAVDEAQEEADGETRHETPVTSVTKSDLWSFVDFNGPEPAYTLRYVVVMEDETLEAVADRCGCTPSELERVNPWLQDQVRSGQALFIPTTSFHIPRVTV